MRRLPIYFLIDVSESMAGVPIQQVQEGMRNIVQDLRSDPYALETVHISIIAFAGKAKQLSPLTEIFKFYPPAFPIGGGTSLGKGLECLMDDIEKNVEKTTAEKKGDWKPIVYLFTDGAPTDNPGSAISRWNAKFRKHANLVAISIGDNADTSLLGQISDNVLRLKETDEHSFRQFFKWVTNSIKASSESVSNSGISELALNHSTGINLEKVSPQEKGKVDDNFVVLRGKCTETGKQYLIKFARKMGGFFRQEYSLEGAYPIDGNAYEALSDGKSGNNFNASQLNGVPACPCCGNQYALVACSCGNIFCYGGKPVAKCPWCGAEGSVGDAGSDGVNINRGRG